ncbi:hypothetical protein PV08_07167 [Exophiala spinifera]|uniref:RGS domain-containing protein n=1 Tax=Exophiala spinifera TaxID=91928 RepID=A0A0D2B6S9_9EURO|nr:uncharacterized protein PV08_07167 [Exophiala spinifera]KIW14385.1 hypothetical protein PV08_07167 [Exophiala spinifera]
MFSSLPSWLDWYRKPSYRDPIIFSASIRADLENGLTSRPGSISSQSDSAIPSNLTLDHVLNNDTCSPLSLYDFYMYLKHIERSPENLEFYIWFKDYEARYNESSHTNSPTQETPLLFSSKDEKSSSAGGGTYCSLGFGAPGDATELSTPTTTTTTTIAATQLPDPAFQTYIEDLVVSQGSRRCRPFWDRSNNNNNTNPNSSDKTLVHAQAHTHGGGHAADLATKTATTMSAYPYTRREEVSHVVARYLTEDSPRELNVPPSMRAQVLSAMARGDLSPGPLRPVAEHVYYLLRNCSHRNFIRLGVKNGTFETLCMVTVVGVLFTALGLLTMLLVAFASPSVRRSSRWRGLASAPFWVVGFSFLFAGWRGSCFLLLLFSRRQELPWERLSDDGSTRTRRSSSSNNNNTATTWGRGLVRFAKKMMIFERKIRVKDRGLRKLQRKIVVQSVVGAVLATAILEVVFLVLPIWK